MMGDGMSYEEAHVKAMQPLSTPKRSRNAGLDETNSGEGKPVRKNAERYPINQVDAVETEEDLQFGNSATKLSKKLVLLNRVVKRTCRHHHINKLQVELN